MGKDKDKKDKKEKEKKSGGGFFAKVLGRKSTTTVPAPKSEEVPTPENGNEEVGKRKGSRMPSLFSSKKLTTNDKAGKVETKKTVEVGTSYNKDAKKRKPKVPKNKKTKKVEVVIKRGNEKRANNKYFPADVSFKYTSPEEIWIEYLGRKPQVNDFGNGARLILDDTDK